VVPVPKAGNSDDVRCYRPIAILPAIGKVLECLVADRLRPFVAKVICPSQHGFTSGRSTITNLLTFQEYVLSAFRSGHQVDSLYIDFAKAFDKVDHGILVAKLKAKGISGPLLDWVADYLTGRHLTVKVGPARSKPFMQSSGVPQGSILGPHLFNLFVNDLVELVGVRALMFADDVKIFTVISSAADSKRLQAGMDAVIKWCEDNNMTLNPSKCHVTTFHRKRSPQHFTYYVNSVALPRTEAVKDLGVTFGSDLGFSTHIDEVCARANRTLGYISRVSRGMRNPAALRALYCALVRQVVEYGGTVWSPYTACAVDRLEALQRRFLRLVGVRMGLPYRDVPVIQLGSELRLQPLRVRRDVADIAFIYGLLNGRIDCPELLARIDIRVPSSTRSREVFGRRFHATLYDYNNPMSRALRNANTLSREVDFFADSLKYVRRRSYELLS